MPNAGQWILRWAVLSCSLCPCCPQYEHGPRPWLVAGLPWWLFPLAGMALLVGLPLVGLCWLGVGLVLTCSGLVPVERLGGTAACDRRC